MNKYLWNGIGVILISILIVLLISLTQFKKLKQEYEKALNNNYAYEQSIISLQDSLVKERGVYRMTIGELEVSQEKLTKELNQARKSLKIKDKELKEAIAVNSQMKIDTVIKVLPQEKCEFSLDIKYNPLTLFQIEARQVEGEDSLTVKHSANISSSIKVFMYEKTHWKEPNFFKRLFLFKWGKFTLNESSFILDNDKIKVNDFKVIKIE